MASKHRRKKPEDKEKALRVHSWRRALERYGLDLTDELRKEIIDQIRSGKSTAVEKQSERLSIHDVHVAGQRVRVAYDKSRGALVTFLFLDDKDYAVTGEWPRGEVDGAAEGQRDNSVGGRARA